jgi:hypothetical protein
MHVYSYNDDDDWMYDEVPDGLTLEETFGLLCGRWGVEASGIVDQKEANGITYATATYSQRNDLLLLVGHDKTALEAERDRLGAKIAAAEEDLETGDDRLAVALRDENLQV